MDSIWIVEGEKCADALSEIGLLATTSGSATSANNTNWSPLHGRHIIIWPDKDESGIEYARIILINLINKILRRVTGSPLINKRHVGGTPYMSGIEAMCKRPPPPKLFELGGRLLLPLDKGD